MILRRGLEYWGDLLSFDFQWKPPDTTTIPDTTNNNNKKGKLYIIE